MTREALHRLLPTVVLLGLAACDTSRPPRTEVASAPTPAAQSAPARPTNPYEGTLTAVQWPGEKHLANVRQLTFAGENAEAYWSADGKKLIFQSTRPPHRCDQILVVDVDSPGEPRLVSTGKGRTTCSYFFPDGERILYASTHLGGRECPPPPDMSQGYVWALYPDYDLFSARADGTDIRRLTTTPGYDAEATISTDGRRIVFTSVRDGDLDLYSMNADGGDVKRLTRTPGYDGGAFYSDDGEWIVYRASRPETPSAVEEFKALLDRHLVKPGRLEIHVMRADGSNDRQVTSLGAASFAPFFFRGTHERLLFVSNFADPAGRNFDVWAVNADGTDLERITYNPTFDGFPMFSPDGRRLAFCSNRHNGKPNETNVFVADWVP
jgi:Tol biopolymer transport system component